MPNFSSISAFKAKLSGQRVSIICFRAYLFSCMSMNLFLPDVFELDVDTTSVVSTRLIYVL